MRARRYFDDDSRTANGRKRHGRFELWVSYKSRLNGANALKTYRFRRYADEGIARSVGEDLMRKHPGFYVAFEIRG